MKYTAKILDIADRGVLLNASDARTVGVLQGDRVQVLNHAGGLSVPAVVDTTATMIPPGVIGVYGLTNKVLQIVDGAEVEVWEAKKPLALDLIKKKMKR